MLDAKPLPFVDVEIKEIDAMLKRAACAMNAKDGALMKILVDSLIRMTALVRERGTTIARLRRLFGLSGSERSRDVLARPSETADEPGGTTPPGAAPSTQPASPDSPPSPDASASQETKPPAHGHGRIPASDYRAAEHIAVPHTALRVGDPCPKCEHGTLYRLDHSAPVIRIFGNAPLVAKRWDCERLRCSGCGIVHTARAPELAQGPKYDETAAATLALLRYGAGMPFNRLDRLQRDLETPVPSSTQWDILNERVELVRPAYDELRRLAAQGTVLYNDDSYVRILAFMGKRRAALVAAGKLPDPERTGLFTTAIVATTSQGTIALFSTGRNHAGENLEHLLDLRDPSLDPPIQMSDALSRNVPKGHAVVESNCIVHGRRHVVDERENHPVECRHLIERIALVYKVEKECKTRGDSDDERLVAHQRESGPVMDDLRRWMTEQIEHKHVEPNSGLGNAFEYFLKRWEKFTLFLRRPGAPLDNNLAERALKKAIRQRRASLFYRSDHGASVGDVYMTLIHTTELHEQNPFEYLTALQRNAKAVAAHPNEWLPWNYRQTLARCDHANARAAA